MLALYKIDTGDMTSVTEVMTGIVGVLHLGPHVETNIILKEPPRITKTLYQKYPDENFNKDTICVCEVIFGFNSKARIVMAGAVEAGDESVFETGTCAVSIKIDNWATANAMPATDEMNEYGKKCKDYIHIIFANTGFPLQAVNDKDASDFSTALKKLEVSLSGKTFVSTFIRKLLIHREEFDSSGTDIFKDLDIAISNRLSKQSKS